jgi:hypothetical protein
MQGSTSMKRHIVALTLGLGMSATAAWAQTTPGPTSTFSLTPTTPGTSVGQPLPGTPSTPGSTLQPSLPSSPLSTPTQRYQSLNSPGVTTPPSTSLTPPPATSAPPASCASASSVPPGLGGNSAGCGSTPDVPSTNSIGGIQISPNNPNASVGGVQSVGGAQSVGGVPAK